MKEALLLIKGNVQMTQIKESSTGQSFRSEKWVSEKDRPSVLVSHYKRARTSARCTVQTAG